MSASDPVELLVARAAVLGALATSWSGSRASPSPAPSRGGARLPRGRPRRRLLHRPQGHLRVTREHSDGRAITLANLGPGDIFGELAMLDGEARSASVEALEDSELLALPAGDVRRCSPSTPRSR